MEKDKIFLCETCGDVAEYNDIRHGRVIKSCKNCVKHRTTFTHLRSDTKADKNKREKLKDTERIPLVQRKKKRQKRFHNKEDKYMVI